MHRTFPSQPTATAPEDRAAWDVAAVPAATLPPLPMHDLTASNAPMVALMEREPDRLAALVAISRRHYTPAFVALADRLSRRWLDRNTTPYRREIQSIAAAMDRAGGHFLNVSFEWSCTCGVAADPAGSGMRLLRVLDWPLQGLGDGLVAVRQRGRAGDFISLTWPGFVGVVTALAPGRFAAALNQAPIPSHGMGWMGDWAAERVAVWRNREVPPMHLLRQVMEDCPTYRDARHALAHTPVAIGGLFTLAGTQPGEGCVIERTRDAARVFDAPVCVANDWLSTGRGGKMRGVRSAERRALMETVHQVLHEDFGWLAAPVLNPTTRLVCEMNPASGRLLAQGWEAHGPATGILRLDG